MICLYRHLTMLLLRQVVADVDLAKEISDIESGYFLSVSCYLHIQTLALAEEQVLPSGITSNINV